MTTAEELIAHLKHFEGFVAHPYLCSAGKLTIGYGHRIDAPRANMTEPEAASLLLEDIGKYTMMAVKLSPDLVNVGGRRLNAIIDFVFNAGPTNYETSRLRAAVNRRDWPTAVMQNNRWVYITDPHTGQKNVSSWQRQRRSATSEWLKTG